jgi:hypothetical protein
MKGGVGFSITNLDIRLINPQYYKRTSEFVFERHIRGLPMLVVWLRYDLWCGVGMVVGVVMVWHRVGTVWVLLWCGFLMVAARFWYGTGTVSGWLR